MIMLTVTKPRRKLKRLLKGGALLLLLGVVVPGIYHGLQTVGAMSLFASGESVQTETGVPTEQSAPPEQAGAVPTENVHNSDSAESVGNAEKSGNAENTESTESAGSIEGTDSAESINSTESTINAENTESTGSTEEEVDKPGLLERLKAVIFGEQATVQPY